ncbi:hypothetical protein EOT10_35340 [Streptomyces antnestii]|uniref:Uncharacterized protein n=1 Tax=Streptomyces antnestii TaxID=2494256 RepID=A0A437P414_9ACTN|nr:hypothetical protein [Streptomyces sp. San01]RVU17027.1 hypothetical protein EOT10_35340 [Streptomyces sp. San01]
MSTETTTQAAPEAGVPHAPAPKDRRVARAVLRWTAAVVVFGALAGATAYGVTEQRRTDLPGLATASDGRWTYPELVRPPLPEGSPAPFARANRTQAHYADPRALVIKAPDGARPDPGLKTDDGWVPTSAYLAQYAKDEREGLGEDLADSGVRHIAGRGWTMPDGTTTRVFLLHFGTGAEATGFCDRLTGGYAPSRPLAEAPDAELDESYPEEARVEHVSSNVYDETRPRGAVHVRSAYLVAGDTVGLITQSRRGTAHAVPFRQTVTLQSQLLG